MKKEIYREVALTKKGKEIILRFPKLSDVEKLMNYINDLVREDTFIAANKIVTYEEEKKYVKERLKKIKSSDGVNIVAEHKGLIVANAELTRGDKNRRAGHTALLGISVAFGYRDEGLGSLLMEKLLRFAKEKLKVRLVHLTVYAINDRAKHLYSKFGFRECGCMPKSVYYRGDYVDQVYMVREL
jgi:RimJ/RimL family protein N-acetyltransferase